MRSPLMLFQAQIENLFFTFQVRHSRLSNTIVQTVSSSWKIEKIDTIPEIRVADQHHFNVDPDPVVPFNASPESGSSFSLNADPDSAPHQNDKNLKSTGLQSTDPPGLHLGLEPPRPHCERPRPSAAPFWASRVLNFDFNADPCTGIQLFNLCGSRSSVQK